jgi:hypothetical protein
MTISQKYFTSTNNFYYHLVTSNRNLSTFISKVFIKQHPLQ